MKTFNMDLNLLLLLLSVYVCSGIEIKSLRLKQILILSRHNVRTPLGIYVSTYTPKKVPEFHNKPGYLTRKGALLEGNMGDYFSEWFNSEQFLTEMCPSEDEVYVYANSVNRTIETAKAFVEPAFRGCNVKVNHKITKNEEEMDPNFDPVIHNNTDAFKTIVINEVNRKITNNRKLMAGLSALNKILDIEHSEVCQTQSICDLTDMSKNNISLKINQEFWVYGPLFIGNTVADYIKMSYYDGLPIEDVAWGLVKTPLQWHTITEFEHQNMDIIYGTVVKDIGARLLQLLISTFLEFDNKPKLTLIVGHDFNQFAFAENIGLKELRLPYQFELFPIGGKLVFQRWTDDENDYLKIEHIYASWLQVRKGANLSLCDPPQRAIRQLKWCKVDKNGFCPWSEFISKLKHLG